MTDNLVNSFHVNFEHQANYIMEEIMKFSKKGEFTDVTLVVGQEEFLCHKLILAASSNYFKTMFTSSFKENIDSKVYFESVSPWSIKCIIDFIYTGDCRLSMAHVQDLLQAAEMLEYPVLVTECAKFMVDNLDVGNCFEILKVAKFFKIDFLEAEAQSFIEKNFKKIGLSSSEWLNLETDTVVDCISNSLIDVRSEKVVWDVMMRWVRHDTDNRATYLPTLVRSIRLHQLDPQFLEDALKFPIIQNSPETYNVISEFLWSKKDDIIVDDVRPSTIKKPTMILLGGMDHSILNKVDSFNPVNRQWTPLTPLPEKDVIWFSSSIMDNKIYVTGGIQAGEIISQAYCYDPDYDEWTRCNQMLSPRAKHGSTSINGHLILLGGLTVSRKLSEFLSVQFNDTVDMYSVETDQWTSVCLTKHPRIESCLVAVKELGGSGKEWLLYEVGGSYQDSSENDQIAIYRVSEQLSIEPLEYYIKLPLCMNDTKCVVNEEGTILYIFWENCGKLAQLNIKTNSIHFLPEFPDLKTSRIHCGFCYLSNINSLAVVGGYQRSSGSTLNPISSAFYCFDIQSKKWSVADKNRPYLDRAILGAVVVTM